MTTDILFGSDGDLQWVNGDMVIGDSTQQHQYDLLVSYKGWYKFSPQIGAGVVLLDSDELDENEVKRLVRSEFEKDGMTVESVTITKDGRLDIQAYY